MIGLSLWTCVLLPGPARAQPDAAECGDSNLLAGMRPSALTDTRGDADFVTDGKRAPEGTNWNGAGTLLLSLPSATITYDLGQPRRASTVLAQADANDIYQLSASLDGEHFEPLTSVPNVVQSGHGLRTRTSVFPERTLRYLRFGPSTGDGLYSLSELGLYCRAPEQPAQPASPAATSGKAQQQPQSLQLLPFAALMLCGLGLLFTRGSVRAAAPRSEAGAKTSTRNTERWLHVMFLCSGAAALIYEIVWFHLLRLVIGASALSVGLVLASFMGGMFLGSLSFARLVPSKREPLRVYAVLELLIGAFGLVMPLILPFVRSIYIGLVGHGAASIALRAGIAACLLLPPTALMGATLPAIARRYGNTASAGASLASLYTANTLGAVLGSVLTGFWLLAVGDVWVATFAAVALNVAVGCAALLRSRSAAVGSNPAPADVPAKPSERPSLTRAVYLATLLSGLTALGAQVIWTRLLTLLFGATVYAFSIILAVFLAGLGIGSALATRLLRRGGDPLRGLLFSQLGLIASLFGAAWLLARVLPYSAPSTLTPTSALHVLDSLRALDVILPSACLWGMSFPFGLAAVGGSDADAGRASGRLYAMNTLGAILGAIVTSYLTIPRLGTHASAQLLVLGAAIAAAVLVFAREPLRAAARAKLERGLQVALAIACGWVAASALPRVGVEFLAHGRHVWSIDSRDVYPYVSEGAAATVAVHIAPDGYRHFHVSGRVEASSNPDDMRLQRLLGHLSVLAHPAPHSVLVVGLGGGVTAGALRLHPEVKRIVICEIEPRVTGATREFSRENYDILSDPRVELVFDDARHYLATTSERFDVITSDPIHPWVRGNSVLFSRQYYSIVREHLRPGGIATQWVPLYDTNAEAIQIQMRTFTAAFPHASVWNSAFTRGGYDVVLLGSPTPRKLSLPEIQARIDNNEALARSLREVSLGSARELLATYAVSGDDMADWTRGAQINDDLSLRLEYTSGLALNQQHADEIYKAMVARATPPTQLFEGPEMEIRTLLAKIAQPRSP